MATIAPFTVSVSDAELDDLRRRLRNTSASTIPGDRAAFASRWSKHRPASACSRTKG